MPTSCPIPLFCVVGNDIELFAPGMSKNRTFNEYVIQNWISDPDAIVGIHHEHIMEG